MLSPKRTKFRKQFKGRLRPRSKRGTELTFGDFGLQAVGAGHMTARQIEACRIAITRKIKRLGKVWIRVFPDKVITQKPAETRMGGGKGNPEFWVAAISPGRILYEMEGVPESLAQEAMRLAAAKLPFPTKMVKREDF